MSAVASSRGVQPTPRRWNGLDPVKEILDACGLDPSVEERFRNEHINNGNEIRWLTAAELTGRLGLKLGEVAKLRSFLGPSACDAQTQTDILQPSLSISPSRSSLSPSPVPQIVENRDTCIPQGTQHSESRRSSDFSIGSTLSGGSGKPSKAETKQAATKKDGSNVTDSTTHPPPKSPTLASSFAALIKPLSRKSIAVERKDSFSGMLERRGSGFLSEIGAIFGAKNSQDAKDSRSRPGSRRGSSDVLSDLPSAYEPPTTPQSQPDSPAITSPDSTPTPHAPTVFNTGSDTQQTDSGQQISPIVRPKAAELEEQRQRLSMLCKSKSGPTNSSISSANLNPITIGSENAIQPTSPFISLDPMGKATTIISSSLSREFIPSLENLVAGAEEKPPTNEISMQTCMQTQTQTQTSTPAPESEMQPVQEPPPIPPPTYKQQQNPGNFPPPRSRLSSSGNRLRSTLSGLTQSSGSLPTASGLEGTSSTKKISDLLDLFASNTFPAANGNSEQNDLEKHQFSSGVLPRTNTRPVNPISHMSHGGYKSMDSLPSLSSWDGGICEENGQPTFPAHNKISQWGGSIEEGNLSLSRLSSMEKTDFARVTSLPAAFLPTPMKAVSDDSLPLFRPRASVTITAASPPLTPTSEIRKTRHLSSLPARAGRLNHLGLSGLSELERSPSMSTDAEQESVVEEEEDEPKKDDKRLSRILSKHTFKNLSIRRKKAPPPLEIREGTSTESLRDTPKGRGKLRRSPSADDIVSTPNYSKQPTITGDDENEENSPRDVQPSTTSAPVPTTFLQPPKPQLQLLDDNEPIPPPFDCSVCIHYGKRYRNVAICNDTKATDIVSFLLESLYITMDPYQFCLFLEFIQVPEEHQLQSEDEKGYEFKLFFVPPSDGFSLAKCMATLCQVLNVQDNMLNTKVVELGGTHVMVSVHIESPDEDEVTEKAVTLQSLVEEGDSNLAQLGCVGITVAGEYTPFAKLLVEDTQSVAGIVHRWGNGMILRLVKRPLVNKISVWVGTWNMGDAPPPNEFIDWLPRSEYDIYVIGVQECSYEPRLGYTSLSEDWEKTILGHFAGRVEVYKVRSMRLWGICLTVLARVKHRDLITNVEAEKIPTGIGNMAGNKGGCAISFTFEKTRLCFLNSHLAAHQEKVLERNTMYYELIKRLSKTTMGLDGKGTASFDLTNRFHYFFWMGDLNYRINKPREEAMNLAVSHQLEELRKSDQLIDEMSSNRAFSIFKEGALSFVPTYKFDRGNRNGYSEDRARVPSWCDRILWRALPNCNVSQITYNCGWEVTTSDHSPVYSIFTVDYRRPVGATENRISRRRKMKEKMGRVMNNSKGHSSSTSDLQQLEQSKTSRLVVILSCLQITDIAGLTNPSIKFFFPYVGKLPKHAVRRGDKDRKDYVWEWVHETAILDIQGNVQTARDLASEYIPLVVLDHKIAGSKSVVAQGAISLAAASYGARVGFEVQLVDDGKIVGVLSGKVLIENRDKERPHNHLKRGRAQTSLYAPGAPTFSKPVDQPIVSTGLQPIDDAEEEEEEYSFSETNMEKVPSLGDLRTPRGSIPMSEEEKSRPFSHRSSLDGGFLLNNPPPASGSPSGYIDG